MHVLCWFLDHPEKRLKVFSRQVLLVLAIALSLTISQLCRALSEPLPQSIKFQHLLENKDFALGDVLGLLQDSQGFMWLGGSNGLIRYDGYEFKFVYLTPKRSSNPSLPPESRLVKQVTSIYEDSDHLLWVVTTANLLRYDPRTESLTAIPNDPTSLPISNTNLRGVVEIPSGELLVATWNGLFILDRKTYHYTAIVADSAQKDGLHSSVVNVTYVDHFGTLWLGTNAGLEKLDWQTKKFTLIKPFPARTDLLEANQVFDITADRDGSLWLGTADGLVNYNPATALSTRYVNDPKDTHSFSSKPVAKLMLDATGTLWIATDGGGISVFEKTEQFPAGRFSTHQWQPEQAASLSTNVVRAIYEDRAGDVWVGNYPSGINYFDRSSEVLTTLFDEQKTRGLAQTAILAVREDAAHNLWMGTDGGGLNRFDRESGQLTNYKPEPGNPKSLRGNAVLDVLIASDGKIWTGTWDGGVSVLNPATGEFLRMPFDPLRINTNSITTSHRLNNGSVWTIKEDRQKNIWLGTFRGGLSKFDPTTETYTHYAHREDDPGSLSLGMVWNTFEDSKGNFWVGTFTGLDLLDRATGIFKHFKHDPKDPTSLSNASVTAFLEDHKHQLWIGTEAGLNRLNPDEKTFTVFNKATGFNDDSIKTIVEDAKGQLWLATNNGVTLFNPDTQKIKNLSLDGNHLMGIFHIDSGLLSSKGEVILGGVEGLRLFAPKKLKDNKVVPPIVFTGLKIFTDEVSVGNSILSQSLNHTKTIVLDYTQNMFQLSFSALNFSDSKKNQYAYKLEGFDSKWLFVGDQRRAVYTNLDAGTYVFRVKGSNNDGVWNEQGAAITIVRLPPPWKTWWAYTLYGCIFIFIIAFYVNSQRQKRRELEKQNRILETKVVERTAEISQKNIELRRLTDDALAEAKAKSEFLAKMSHEIRTPMNGVLGMAELLQDTPLQLQQTHYIKTIYNSGKALLNVLNDILDYSKIESGKLEIEQLLFDIETLIDESISIFSLTCAERHVTLIQYISPQVPKLVISDPTRLRQILMNLLSNALKFTEAGNVTLTVLLISEHDGHLNIRFEIKDSGIGISTEQQQKLFQSFSQADVSTARKYGGTGLGLAICKQLSELMGGNIGVTSTLGEGATFWFTINALKAPHQKNEKLNAELQTLRNRHLLLVDANQDFVELTAKAAEGWGLIAHTASAGTTAVEKMRELREQGINIDIALLEMNLPDTTGFKLAEQLTAMSLDHPFACLLVTLERNLRHKIDIELNGIRAVLEKPLPGSYLRKSLCLALRPEHNVEGQKIEETTPLADLSRLKVLLVDDNDVNRMVATGMLKKLGITHEVAENGLIAVEKYTHSHPPFDLILMDCEMSVMDGYEATQQIRLFEQGTAHRARIIALTAHAIKERIDTALNAGMDDHLAKPISIEQLRQSLNKNAML